MPGSEPPPALDSELSLLLVILVWQQVASKDTLLNNIFSTEFLVSTVLGKILGDFCCFDLSNCPNFRAPGKGELVFVETIDLAARVVL